MMLIYSYSVSFSDLKLQHQFRNMHSFNTVMSEAIMMQTVERMHRLEQTNNIKVYNYHVSDPFNVYQMVKTAEKAVSDLIAELNKKIFSINHTEKSESRLSRSTR